MLIKRLENRVGNIKDIGIGTLSGYNLKFNKQSTDGSGKTNVVPQEKSEVLGVVYELTAEQQSKLDSSEIGYSRVKLEVTLDTFNTYMYVYIADQGMINNSLMPTYKYLNYLIQGATEHHFPEFYIETLKLIKTLN